MGDSIFSNNAGARTKRVDRGARAKHSHFPPLSRDNFRKKIPAIHFAE
jgi:hypothetical protein